MHDATEGTKTKASLHDAQVPAEKVSGMYPSAHIAEEQSLMEAPAQRIHALTDGTDSADMLQEMHVAVVNQTPSVHVS